MLGVYVFANRQKQGCVSREIPIVRVTEFPLSGEGKNSRRMYDCCCCCAVREVERGVPWRATFNYEGVAGVWWRAVAAAVMDQDAGVPSRPLKYSAQVMDSPALACLAADLPALLGSFLAPGGLQVCGAGHV